MDQPHIPIVPTNTKLHMHKKHKYAENRFLPITNSFTFRQHTNSIIMFVLQLRKTPKKKIHIRPSSLNIYVPFMLPKSGICMLTMIMQMLRFENQLPEDSPTESNSPLKVYSRSKSVVLKTPLSVMQSILCQMMAVCFPALSPSCFARAAPSAGSPCAAFAGPWWVTPMF